MFGRKESILFGIGSVGLKDNKIYCKRDMADAIGISITALDRHLVHLRSSGYLKKDNGPGSVCGHSLTEIGKERYETIYDQVQDMILTPEQHSVSVVCHLKSILKYINDPLLTLKIVSNTLRGKKIDVLELLKMYSLQRTGSGYTMMIDEVLSIPEEGQLTSPDDMLLVLTNMGLEPGESISRMQDQDMVRSFMSTAEYKRRNGDLDEAICMYDRVLRSIPGLPPNIWIIAYTNKLKCIMGLGRYNEFFKLIEHSIQLVKNSVHRAMIRQIKADQLSLKGEYEESEKIYRSCLGVYSAKDLPILGITALNNMGVMFFRQGRSDIAVQMWRKAYKIARERELLWAQAILAMNIGDHIAFNKGQFKRGRDLVRDARKIMERLDDMEGVSDAEFNYALVCLAEDKVPLALKHFNKSLKYPILDHVKRDERTRVFNDRLEKCRQKLSISYK